MRAALYCGLYSIELGNRPDPVLVEPTDAAVRVVLACVCGSDLWYYRGESPHAVGSIGHERSVQAEEVAEASGVAPPHDVRWYTVPAAGHPFRDGYVGFVSLSRVPGALLGPFRRSLWTAAGQRPARPG